MNPIGINSVSASGIQSAGDSELPAPSKVACALTDWQRAGMIDTIKPQTNTKTRNVRRKILRCIYSLSVPFCDVVAVRLEERDFGDFIGGIPVELYAETAQPLEI